MPRLRGKRALITGGTSGIGLETARRFLEEGARVAITGLNKAALDAARKELRDVIVIEVDAANAADQGKLPRKHGGWQAVDESRVSNYDVLPQYFP